MERDAEVVSYTMSRIRGKNTSIELKLRRALRELGVSYRVCCNDVFGHPDIVIKSLRIAIFCDSEFWHGYHFEENKKKLHKNLDYWIPKIERNIERDKEVNETLKEQGYLVLRFWGEEINKSLDAVVSKIMECVNRRKEILSRKQGPFELTTLIYIEQNHAYLMLHRNKEEHDINEGKWLGVGGHLEEGETPAQCLKREVKEETGLEVKKYRYLGKVYFLNSKYTAEIMYLYHVTEVEGTLIECDEGELRYIDIDQVYDLPMWDGDRMFLPLIQQDKGVFEMSLGYEGDELVDCIGPIYRKKKKKNGKRQKRNTNIRA